jgi:hypothetical protein
MHAIVNGKAVQPRIFMAVLYDPATGDIAHSHRVLQFDPAQKITKAHVEERAREMATQHGWDVSKLKLLHVDHSKLQRGMRYQVDPKARKLVGAAMPRPALPSGPLRLKK